MNLGNAKNRRLTNIEIIKKNKFSLVVAIALPATVFFFFFRMYQKDVRELADFSAFYEKFDKAISGFPWLVSGSSFEDMPAVDSWERKADEALFDLKAKAGVRLSSLIKNEAELMSITLEISDLAGKEREALRAYRRAVSDKDINADRLAKEFADLTDKRLTAYLRFRELSGLKD